MIVVNFYCVTFLSFCLKKNYRNHLLGSISIEEMQVYESEFGGSILTLEKIPFLSNIHCFVFLNDEVKKT